MDTNKKALLEFADAIKWEFFTRLKDETKPAGKEFSYVDLLSILETVYDKYGITKKEISDYDTTKPSASLAVLDAFPELKSAVEKALKEPTGRGKKKLDKK